MRKFVAPAAIAASAAATLVLSPVAAHAAQPFQGEIRTGCQNGVTGYFIDPAGGATPFSLVPGTSFTIADPPANPPVGTNPYAGQWQFYINQPPANESYGPALGSDRSGGWETQRVEKAVVTLDDGRTMIFHNDKANGFAFHNAPGVTPVTPDAFGVPFHVYYQCGIGNG